jgi:hypothetical protein
MRCLRIILSVIVVLAFVPRAQAGKGDWRAVEKLQPGSRISIKIFSSPFRLICFFVRATDQTLTCELPQHGYVAIGPSEITSNRGHVREVRLEFDEEADAAIGAAIGAGVGAAVGASKNSKTSTRGERAVVLGIVGGAIGGIFGKDFPVFHGKIVYQR